jgi:hypothetical protein
MRKFLISCLLIFSQACFSAGSDLLVRDKGTKNFVPIVKKIKQVVLDDPFVVQVYGALRVYGVTDTNILAGYDELFQKNYHKALSLLYKTKASPKIERLVSATKIYLFYKLDLSQSMINLWINESAENNLANTQLGVSLDQVIGESASKWILKKSIYLSSVQKERLNLIKNEKSKFNYSLQSYANLRAGHDSLNLLGKLDTNDPLRYLLANTIIIAFAEENKLAEAGEIVKEVIEPVIKNDENMEKISRYYLTLARLLYQAGAYEASKQYFNAIPDESSEFLKSRVESLWVSMIGNDHSVILGELKSLELTAFEKEFLPELHLVSAMANLQLCQFSAVEKSFKNFIRTNKRHLEAYDKKKSQLLITELAPNNFFIKKLLEFKKIGVKELGVLQKLKLDDEAHSLKISISMSKNNIENEINTFRSGQKKLIEMALRNMRFVKIEYLSTMRRFKDKLAGGRHSDKVSIMTSAIDKADKLEFRYDGVLFGDELFNMRSKIKNFCLKDREQ